MGEGGFAIASAAVDAVVRHAVAAQPAECCGLLIGADRQIAEAIPARNLAEDRNRFLVDPQDHIAARREARRRGLEVLGFYHSHPHTGAAPSPTDLAEATDADAVYLIVGLREARPEVRLFRIEHATATELPLDRL